MKIGRLIFLITVSLSSLIFSSSQSHKRKAEQSETEINQNKKCEKSVNERVDLTIFSYFPLPLQKIIIAYLASWGDQESQKIQFYDTPVTNITFSSDSSLLGAVGFNNKYVLLHDLITTKTVSHEFAQNGEMPLSVALSPDAKYIAAGSTLGNCAMWDTSTQKLHHLFNNPKRQHHKLDEIVSCPLMISPSGRYLCLYSLCMRDCTFKFWDIQSKQNYQNGFKIVQPKHISFSLDGNYIARVNNNKVDILNAGLQIVQTEQMQSSIEAIALSPDGTLLALGKSTGEVELWENKVLNQVGQKWEKKLAIESHDSDGTVTIQKILFSPNGKYLAWNSVSKKKERIIDIHLYTLKTNAELCKEIPSVNNYYSTFAFSGDSSLLNIFFEHVPKQERIVYLSRKRPFQVTVLSTENGACVQILEHADYKLAAPGFPYAVSPNGKYLAIGAATGHVHVWKNQAIELSQALYDI